MLEKVCFCREEGGTIMGLLFQAAIVCLLLKICFIFSMTGREREVLNYEKYYFLF